MSSHEDAVALPGADLDAARMPGHWLLARLGKRVLRPGGLELTQQMLDALNVKPSDDVVELAPGLGTTTRLLLQRGPASYVGVDRDEAAVAATRRLLRPGRDQCRKGVASQTGLADQAASVVFGEAMLTMQTDTQKDAIVAEAVRVLRAGGRYGIHELALQPDDLSPEEKELVHRDLSAAIHVGARPLTVSEWRAVLEKAGLEVIAQATAPMHLLELGRVVRDEGLAGAARITLNVLRDAKARARVLEMRSVFRTHAHRMCAMMLVAQKSRPAPRAS